MSHSPPFPSSSPDFFAGEAGFESGVGASVLNGMMETGATDTDGDEWSAAEARALNDFESTYPISQIQEPFFRGMWSPSDFHSPPFTGEDGIPADPATSSDTVMADSMANLNLSSDSALNGGGHAAGAMAPSNSPTFHTLELGDWDAYAGAIHAVYHAHHTSRGPSSQMQHPAMPPMPVDFTTMEPSSGRTRKPRTVRRGPATVPRYGNRRRGRAATLPASELEQLVAAADALNV
ncbi:hypothetical protein DFH06DRAFT_1481843 [Mycena polygramma]|nr:hypothetical protein DFH06DRAFT_1481843 [Mycena polygramma]